MSMVANNINLSSFVFSGRDLSLCCVIVRLAYALWELKDGRIRGAKALKVGPDN